MLPFRNGPDGLIEGSRSTDNAPHERKAAAQGLAWVR
jgi:hypothetical protein